MTIVQLSTYREMRAEIDEIEQARRKADIERAKRDITDILNIYDKPVSEIEGAILRATRTINSGGALGYAIYLGVKPVLNY